MAIYVRYDSVFGNIDIQALLSEFIIADQTLTRALNMFSIVVVTFSSASIVLLIYSFGFMVSTKWRRLLLLIVSVKEENTFIGKVNDLRKGKLKKKDIPLKI